MTTVVQTTTQPGGYPPQPGYPQQQGYPQQAYPQQGYPPQQQQATVIQAPTTMTNSSGSNPSKNERYNKRAGLVTGVLQIIAGVLLVLLGIIVLVLGSWFRLSWSIWGGICFYVVTGILGVVSKTQSKCVIIAYMVMSIISAVCAGSQMLYDATAAGTSRFHGGYICSDYNDYNDYYYYYYATCGKLSAVIAMHSLSALVALGEMIIAIVASAYCCAGCCGTTAATQTTIVTYSQPAPIPQVTMVSPGGYPPATTYPQASGGAYPQVPPAQPPNYTQQQPTYEEPKKEAM